MSNILDSDVYKNEEYAIEEECDLKHYEECMYKFHNIENGNYTSLYKEMRTALKKEEEVVKMMEVTNIDDIKVFYEYSVKLFPKSFNRGTRQHARRIIELLDVK